MNKNMVLMTVIGLSIASNVTAMLVKLPKKLVLKHSQVRLHNKLYQVKIPSQWGNGMPFSFKKIAYQNLFRHSVCEKDIKDVDFLLQNRKENIYIDNDIIEDIESLEMLRVLEKYGLDIKDICLNGGNFLHYAIKKSKIDDSLIQYAFNQWIDPNALDDEGNNLWHHFAQYPCWWEWNQFSDSQIYQIKNRAELLRKLGVSVHVQNKEGLYPIDILEKQNASGYSYPNVLKAKRELRRIIDDIAQEKVNKE